MSASSFVDESYTTTSSFRKKTARRTRQRRNRKHAKAKAAKTMITFEEFVAIKPTDTITNKKAKTLLAWLKRAHQNVQEQDLLAGVSTSISATIENCELEVVEKVQRVLAGAFKYPHLEFTPEKDVNNSFYIKLGKTDNDIIEALCTHRFEVCPFCRELYLDNVFDTFYKGIWGKKCPKCITPQDERQLREIMLMWG